MFHLCQCHLKSSTATETFLLLFLICSSIKVPAFPTFSRKAKTATWTARPLGQRKKPPLVRITLEESGCVTDSPVHRDAASFPPERETSSGKQFFIFFSQSSPQGSNSSTSTEFAFFDGVSGELELCLTYSSSASCLEITVGACRNLSSRGPKRKKCHP